MDQETIADRLRRRPRRRRAEETIAGHEKQVGKRRRNNRRCEWTKTGQQSSSKPSVGSLQLDHLDEYSLGLVFDRLSLPDRVRCSAVSRRWQLLVTRQLARQTSLGMKWLAKNQTNSYGACECDPNHDFFGGNNFIDSTLFEFVENADDGQVLATLRNEDDCCRHFGSVLKKCPKIRSLDLRGFFLYPSLVQLIHDCCPALECLQLNCMEVDASTWTSITSLLSHRLQHLVIRNSMSVDQEAIVKQLISQCDRLEVLKIVEWNPKINGDWLSSVGRRIHEFHLACSSAERVLEQLDCEGHHQNIDRLKITTFEQLSQRTIDLIGSRLTNLTRLNIANCEGLYNRHFRSLAHLTRLVDLSIDLPFANRDEDLTALCYGCPLVKRVEFSFGMLSLNSLVAMADGWSRLEALTLRFVSVERINSQAIDVLGRFSQLKTLNLYGTSVNDSVVEVVCRIKPLRQLILDLCEYVTIGLVKEFLAKASVDTQHLFQLSIRNTKIRRVDRLRDARSVGRGVFQVNNALIYHHEES